MNKSHKLKLKKDYYRANSYFTLYLFLVIAIITLLNIILLTKNSIEIDKNMIWANNSNIFDIDIKYVL